MSAVFEGKVRRLGNSMAVIIPKEILAEVGVKEGENLKLVIPISKQTRKKVIKKMAGIDAGTRPFEREKRDRI